MLKTIITLLMLAALASSPAAAWWQSVPQVAIGAGGGGTVYVGPGDLGIGTAVAFYSCRAYSAAKAGTKAYRIVRSGDSAQTDINSNANGTCDTTTPATFCAGAGSTACYIVTYYDQTGALACAGGTACDVTQAVNGNRPQWTASALNGWPCGAGLGTTALQSSTSLTYSQPFVQAAIADRNAAFTSFNTLLQDAANTVGLYYPNVANEVGVGSVLPTAADSAFHAIIALLSGASNSTVMIDGTTSSPGNGGTSSYAASNIVYFASAAANGGLNGYSCEAGIWPSLSPTQQTALNANMRDTRNGWNF